jgi:hypothetical protein
MTGIPSGLWAGGKFTVGSVFAALGADETMKGMERQIKNPKTTLGILVEGRFVVLGSSMAILLVNGGNRI